MPKKRRPKGSQGDSLRDTYAKIRKPVPPPSRVEEDRRREILDDIDRREIEADTSDTPERVRGVPQKEEDDLQGS